jgi:outer membrane protein OmpA-like peptidoglycan-associated protein
LADISAAADKAAQLDKGIEPVVTELVAYIEGLREQASQAEQDLTDTRTRVGELEEEIRDLDERLGGVSQERVALVQRLEAEARIREQFAAIENLFTRDEARVSREGNRMVIRLVGLTFQSGQDVVRPAYQGLLEKVRQAADVFPRSQLTIEGHTDSYGGDENNLALSRRRAEAVSLFLTSQLSVPAFRISSVGYGETQPIANNDTEQGRERNRRIDVIIEPQLESAPQ